MKILYVSNRVPFPLNEGGTICIYNYLRGYSEAGVEVTFAALNGIKHSINIKEATRELSQYCKLFIVDIDSNVKAGQAFLNLFSHTSYNVSRFDDTTFRQLLKDLLTKETFDIIQVEGTFVALYIDTLRHYSNAPIVLRQHNVEYQIWERLASNTVNPLKKWYLNLLSRRLKRFEKESLNRFDALVPITVDDADLFNTLGNTKPVFVSPAGIDTAYWDTSGISGNPFHVYHLGSLDWMPNREAVLWFIKEVWPLVVKTDKRFRLFIAGKNMPLEMKRMVVENVDMVGEVKDGNSFVRDKSICIVPLLSGSGIRLKILEAMAANKLVISTTIGAQGIEYDNGKHLLIADTPDQFSAFFQQIAIDSQCFEHVRIAGNHLIHTRYSNKAVVKNLLDFYQTLILAS